MNPWISLGLTFFAFSLLVGGGIAAIAGAVWVAWKIAGVMACRRRK